MKINSVVLPGENEDSAADLVRFCLRRGLQLRFIEQMPLGPRGQWTREGMVTADALLERLATEFTLRPAAEPRGSAPAELWDVDGGPATVGVIASVTAPFCGACDRTRLTTDGAIRSCLFSKAADEVSLRT